MAVVNPKNSVNFLQPVQKTINTATHTAASIVNTARNVTNKVQQGINTVSNIANTAKNVVQQGVNTAKNLVNTAMNTAAAIKNTATQVGEMVGKFVNGQTVASILSVPANIATSIFEKTASFFKDPAKADHTKLGNHSTGITEAVKKFNSDCKGATASLSKNNSGNLKNDGLFFKASTTNKSVDGISLPGLDQLSSFVEMGAGQLGKLATMGQEALSSVTNGLKAVTNTVMDVYEKGKAAVNTVTSTVGKVVSTVTAPISAVMNAATTLTDPRTYGNIVSQNLNFLPFGIGNMIGNKVTNAVSNLTGNVHSKIQNYAGKVGAINNIANNLSVEGLFESTYKYSYGQGYSSKNNSSLNTPSISGVGGSWLPGQSSFTGSSAQYASVADSIAVLCNDTSIKNNYQTYGENQDVFDMLMQAFLSTNAGKALEALMNCGNDSSYVSGRSRNIARAYTSELAKSGDTYSYKTLLNNFSSDVVKNEKEDVLNLYLNAKGNASTVQDMNEILAKLGVNKADAVYNTNPIGKHTVIDAAKVTAMQLTDKEFKQDLIKSDVEAVNAALALYGSKNGQAAACA